MHVHVFMDMLDFVSICANDLWFEELFFMCYVQPFVDMGSYELTRANVCAK